MRFLGTLAALTLVMSSATACISDEPSCDDVAFYNEQLNEAGQEEFNEDSMNDYAQAADDLAAAEQDCYDNGEEPAY